MISPPSSFSPDPSSPVSHQPLSSTKYLPSRHSEFMKSTSTSSDYELIKSADVQQNAADTTGQTYPEGVQPRVTAYFWAEESSLCFQVDVRGVGVTRREDNHYINGSKLLNAAGLTCEQLYGVLELEKVCHVVKTGPMDLTGVWIPFDRALEFADMMNITDLCYPLFVHNIAEFYFSGQFLYNTNASHARQKLISKTADISDPYLDQLNKRPKPVDYPMLPTPRTGSTNLSSTTRRPLLYISSTSTDRSTDSGYYSAVTYELGQAQFRAKSSTPPPDWQSEYIPDPMSRKATPAEGDFAISISAGTQEEIPNSKYPTLGFASHTSSTESCPTPTFPHSTIQSHKNASKDLSRSSSDALHSLQTDNGQDSDFQRVVALSCSALLKTYIRTLLEFTTRGPRSSQNQDKSTRETERCRKRQTSGRQETLSKKRKFSTNHDRDDNFEDDDGRKPIQNSNSKGGGKRSDEFPLACQFHKYNNQLFGPESQDDAYRSCGMFSFTQTAYLKQHFKRNHYQPKYFCVRCCMKFLSQALLSAHLRNDPQCEKVDPPLYQEKITEDLREELCLDGKNPPGTDRIEYWHKVYDTFFPNDSEMREISPYYEGPYAENLHQFLRFARQIRPQILPIIRRRLGSCGDLSDAEQIRLHDEIEQEVGQRFLEYASRASMPHLGHQSTDRGNYFCLTSASRPQITNIETSDADVTRQAWVATSPPQHDIPKDGFAEVTSSSGNGSSRDQPQTPIDLVGDNYEVAIDGQKQSTDFASVGIGTDFALFDINEDDFSKFLSTTTDNSNPAYMETIIESVVADEWNISQAW